MKKVILLISFLPYLSFGQIFSDFEDGTTSGWTESTAGRWAADASGSIGGVFSLHHIFDNPASGSDCTGMPLTNFHPSEGTTRWTFRIKHGYDPSASNSWALFLMSDHNPASFSNGSDVNGFAIGVNLSGYDDTLRLWKVRNGSASAVATCPVNWQSDIGTTKGTLISVERTETGSWKILLYDEANNPAVTAAGTDMELFNSAWMVLNYRYTSTRDRLLWFDDLRIEGIFYEDRIPPEINSCIITSPSSIALMFDEDPSDEIMNPSVFLPDDSENGVRAVKRTAPAKIEIEFHEAFRNKEVNTLVIKKLCDRFGNCRTDVRVEFTPVRPEPGDVIISEIMADPVPPVSLPEREYLELTNRSPFSFNLRKWFLCTEGQKAVLPEAFVEPGKALILCSLNDTASFSEYGHAVGVKSFPALTDGGKIIWISDSSGNFIHGVEYSSEWYGSSLRENGGWSIEMIDTGFPFFTYGNWEASSSKKGGTPGTVNSAQRSNPDMSFRGIINAFPETDKSILLTMSETTTSLPGNKAGILVDEIPAASLELTDPLYRKFRITPATRLEAGRVCTIFLSGNIHDFAGNEIERRSYRFGLPGIAGRSEMVFNEILFNPVSDEPDFIELYNNSEKIIDASSLCLASINTETGDTSEARLLSAEQRCILPGSYYAVTTDRERIIERYPSAIPDNIFEIPSLPSMPDDRGHLLLLNRQMEFIDEVIYTDDMHYSLLSGREGISLEKIRPGLSSSESINWHSASESSGWGTPGAVNSVFSPLSENADRISFSSGRISPDNDGFEDVLVMDVDAAGAGNVVTVSIFDEKGSFVRRIAENYLAGEKATLIWDATADDGSVVNRGIYIVFIELFDSSGRKHSWKRVCSVIRN